MRNTGIKEMKTDKIFNNSIEKHNLTKTFKVWFILKTTYNSYFA